MSTELAAGSIVAGKYTILSVLGRTPWATTYRALAEPSRALVLKVWPFDPALEAELRRRHDVLLAMPDHGLVPPVELGADEEKAIGWIASTVATTPSLAELVELCPLTPEETAAFLRALTRALAAGPPHLALKPTNVFVGPAPKYAVHLGDYEAFILRRAHESAPLPWDAPEAPGDGRSDVFAAALLAFFAMTRATYWEETEPEPLVKALRGPRVAASVRAHALGATIPPALDAVFARALAVAPETRFARIADLAAAFAKALGVELPASEPMLVAAPPASAPILERPAEEIPAEVPANSNVAVVAAIEVVPLDPSRDVASSVPDLDAFAPKRRSPLLYAGIGAAAFVGIASIVAVLAFGGKKPQAESNDAGGPAPPSSVVLAPPATTIAPVPPPASTSAAPAAPPLAAGESELLVQCEPACDRIAIDGKFVDPSVTTIKVKPGLHGVGVARAGYVGDWKRVDATAGERTTVEFTLTPLAEGVVLPKPAAAKKPCGKFLKRCD